MKFGRNHLNTVISLVAITFLTVVFFLILGANRIIEPRIFNVGIYCLVTQLTGVAAAYLCAVLESFYHMQVKSFFLYNFIGTLNICLGLLGVALFNLRTLTELNTIILFLINLVIGITFYLNIYRSDKNTPK